jgi:hypothetical protein
MFRITQSELENEPITLGETKAFLMMQDVDDYDELIQALITASIDASEKVTGQAYGAKTISIFGNTKKEKVYPIGPIISESEDESNVNYTYEAGFNPLPVALKHAVWQRIAEGFKYRENSVSEAISACYNKSIDTEFLYRESPML